jgi:hypothetical protein
MADYIDTFMTALHAAGLRKKRPAEELESFLVHTIDLRPLKLNLSVFVPFIFFKAQPPQRSDAEVSAWKEILRQLVLIAQSGSAGTSVFLTSATVPPELLNDEDLQLNSIAIMDGPSIRAFLEARERDARYRILGSAIARTVSRLALSPYTPGSPVSGNRFFGRQSALNKIILGKTIKSTTILGNRRIGKTSLMHEVRERLKEVNVLGKTLHFAEIYGSRCKSTADAVYMILERIGYRIPNSAMLGDELDPRYARRMPQLLNEFASSNGTQVVIFIDEYDDLLMEDAKRGFEFTHLLRETSIAGRNCYAVIAGFRYLMHMHSNQASPTYNFTQEVQLTPLSKEDTIHMITDPLSRLGLDLSEADIPMTIYRETRGQPEMVQMYCEAVLTWFVEKGVLPTQGELLEFFYGRPELVRTILHTFLNNTTALEQVVCIELMKLATTSHDGPARYEFRQKDLEQVCLSHGREMTNLQLVRLKANLTVGSFVEEGAFGAYRFATPQLVRFCRKEGFDSLLNGARHRLKNRTTEEELIGKYTGTM